MTSIRSKLVRSLIVKGYMRRAMNVEKKSVAQLRRTVDSMGGKTHGAVAERVMVGQLSAEWVRASSVPASCERVVLYFHGGGFIFGSCDSHRALAARLSRACGARVLVVEYRLAPEFRYPAANEDCIAAYRWLLLQGIPPKKIVIGGDSSGANLALMTLVSLRDADEPLPGAAFVISPWDMLHFDGESYANCAHLDPLNDAKSFQVCVEHYLGPNGNRSPLLSPMRHNLRGLPPLLVHVGGDEVILSDSTRLAQQAKEAGVAVTLQVWDRMWHVFHAFASLVPEAQLAIDDIGAFVRKRLA